MFPDQKNLIEILKQLNFCKIMKKKKPTSKAGNHFSRLTKGLLIMNLSMLCMLIFSVQVLASSSSYADAKKLNLHAENATVEEVITNDAEKSTSAELQGQQQQIEVTGRVTDAASGDPLPGVNIVVQGTTTGTTTNMDGEYSIEAPTDATLVFSFVGYQEVTVGIEGRQEINVAMQQAVTELEEVVAVGYGTQKKVNVIGSVTSTSSEEITLSPVSNVSNTLAGRLPGLIAQQTGGGEPGNDQPNITIRGQSTFGDRSPLVVVDGIPERDMNSVDPNDIESISILKDASAAIYGARAANGVILITTKGGQTEQEPLFEVNFYQGWETPTALPEMTDAPTYATLIREVEEYRGVPDEDKMFSQEDVQKYRSGDYPWTHPNTDWHEATLADFANTHHLNAKVSGGTKNFTYYASFSKHGNNGI